MNQMTRSFATAPVAGHDAPCHVGLIRIGDAMLAIQVDHIREVIPAPKVLFTAAIVAQGLCGMIELRGTVIPVADLRSTLGLPAGVTGDQVILVLRVHKKLIGLLADEVCGIAVASPENVQALSIARSSAGQSLATHTFRWADTVVTLLSAERIVDLPGMPSVEEKQAGAGLGLLANAEPMLLFNIGDLYFGIAAHAVDATAPNAAIQYSPLQSDICLGIIDHHGTEVPVVDTLRILGLGSHAAGVKTSPVLILRYGDGNLLGFVLNGVCDIPRLQPERILPIPALMARRTSLFRGVFTDEKDRQFLVLHPGSLRSQEDLAALARLSRKKNECSGPASDAEQDISNCLPYLTYRAGADLASPLGDILEIVNFPENFTSIAAGPDSVPADGMLGLFTHRGAAIPLVCLASRFGLTHSIDRSAARVLLVLDGNQTIGVVVESLNSIESARLRATKTDNAKTSAAPSGFVNYPMAEFRIDGQVRLLPHIDLSSVVR